MEIFTLLGVFWVCLMILELMAEQFVKKHNVGLVREHLDRTIRVIRLEPVQKDLILAYDAENNQFLAQGTNEDEIRERVMSRFPEKIFLMNEKPFSAMKVPGIVQ
jgi:hypothetical protein